MSLKCKSCGSRKTTVVDAKKLSDETGDVNIMTASAGAVNPIIIIKAIESIAKAIGKVFGFLEVRE
ncbi:MAG: hypothetical protein GY928_39895 [Colwellia sp.]|nr:hypothetical protein [Colwellia sp.]